MLLWITEAAVSICCQEESGVFGEKKVLTVTNGQLQKMEGRYPGIIESIASFEEMELPPCSICSSGSTALVQCGVIGRTISISNATTKFKLVPNRPANGPESRKFFCNDCQVFFDESAEASA
jgi:uncharacterized protein YlaI